MRIFLCIYIFVYFLFLFALPHKLHCFNFNRAEIKAVCLSVCLFVVVDGFIYVMGAIFRMYKCLTRPLALSMSFRVIFG